MCSRLGWRSFPVRPHTKRPALRGWPELASTNPMDLDIWFNQTHADCLVGLATGSESDIGVLDIDVGEGRNGFQSLAGPEARYGRLPTTFTVSTTSRGQHHYSPIPPTGRSRRTPRMTGRLPSGRARQPGDGGGQVLAPKTRVRDGTYEPIIDNVGLARGPDWLEDLFEKVQHLPREVDSTAVGWGR